MDAPDHRLTELLQAWQRGDDSKLDELMAMVYETLRRIAINRMKAERSGHTLQPTALVHEAWMRLSREREAGWRNRDEFFAVAAKTMRHLLVDHARHRLRLKRGAGAQPVDFDAVANVIASPLPDERLLALHDALERLSTLDERQSRVVELRFFAGLSIEEAADVLSLSPSTVKREWATARAWLFRETRDSSLAR